MNPYLPPRAKVSYGTVAVNDNASEVLLREPTNHHGGYVWTFAKGIPEPLKHDQRSAAGSSPPKKANRMESPEDTAHRELIEEYGRDIRILRPIPRWFAGPHWANFFFLANAGAKNPTGRSWETKSVQWFSWEGARAAIEETQVPHRRARDLEILEAARIVSSGEKLSFQPIEWTPSHILVRAADGYAGNLQTDLQDFWKGLWIAANNRESAASFRDRITDSGEEAGDPLLVQAFFLSTAVLLRQIRESRRSETNHDVERDTNFQWWDMIGRSGIRRAFDSIYGGPMTGISGGFWDAADWCRMAGSWVPECILNADKELLAVWCENIANDFTVYD